MQGIFKIYNLKVIYNKRLYKEFELLMYLMRHKSIAVSRDKLMEMVWGYEFAGETRTVDMHIKTLRQKLADSGCPDIIKTVRSVGYKLEA